MLSVRHHNNYHSDVGQLTLYECFVSHKYHEVGALNLVTFKYILKKCLQCIKLKSIAKGLSTVYKKCITNCMILSARNLCKVKYVFRMSTAIVL
jgi:hypothetical protein